MLTNLTVFVFLIALMGGGRDGIDVVSLIPPQAYFDARGIKPTVARLTELAVEEPTSGKKQIAQLLALRQLALNIDAVKNAPTVDKVRQLLQQIAEGKTAGDPAGFAAHYARRTLRALDGGSAEKPAVAGWKEGAAWMPPSVSFLAGLDFRGTRPSDARVPDLAPFFNQLPQEAKAQLFDAFERMGNVRIDRLVGGFAELDDNNVEFFLRASGRMNPQWLAALYGEAKIEERAGGPLPTIQVIRPLHANGKGPALALVGDTDLVVAFVEPMVRKLEAPRFMQAADVTSLDKMLALAARPGPDARQGPLKSDLNDVPATAYAAALGAVPAWLRKDSPYPMPQKIVVQAQRTTGGLELHVQATMDTPDSAMQMKLTLSNARASVLQSVRQLKGQGPITEAQVDSIIALVESIQLNAEGAVLRGRLTASEGAIMSITALASLPGKRGP